MKPAMQSRDARYQSETREASLSLRQLAHELNSLLDGSLRYVSLAMRLLEELEAVDDAAAAFRINSSRPIARTPTVPSPRKENRKAT